MTESKEGHRTRLLYLEDAYLREFDAEVLEVESLNGQVCLILDQTAFYPAHGGQPADLGVIKGVKGEAKVIEVHWHGGKVSHVSSVTGQVEEGEPVKGFIEWNRRYSLMRNHTTAHLMAEAVRKVAGMPIKIVGSGLAVEKARLDLAYESSLGPLLPEIERVANNLIRENRLVEIKMMPRSEAERYVEKFHEDLKILPRHIQMVRIVEVKGWHACACGGTHVRNTGEIGHVQLLRRMSKGKSVERIEFTAKTS